MYVCMNVVCLCILCETPSYLACLKSSKKIFLCFCCCSFFLSFCLSSSIDSSGKDNCSLLKPSYCTVCGCNPFCSVSVRENVRAANLEYAIASFLKWVQLTQLRFVQRLHTHTHMHRERGRHVWLGCRELSEQQLPELSVWAKWQPAGAANVARAESN